MKIKTENITVEVSDTIESKTVSDMIENVYRKERNLRRIQHAYAKELIKLEYAYIRALKSAGEKANDDNDA